MNQAPALPLTAAQAEALRLLSSGYTMKGSARLLGVGEDAFKDRVRQSRYKLGARNNEQAVALAIRQGLI